LGVLVRGVISTSVGFARLTGTSSFAGHSRPMALRRRRGIIIGETVGVADMDDKK
jgi:hypothetical protein